MAENVVNTAEFRLILYRNHENSAVLSTINSTSTRLIPVLRRQGSQVRILSGAPVNENGPLVGPFLFTCVFRPRRRTLFDKLRQQFDPSGEAAKPAGLKQPSGCFK